MTAALTAAVFSIAAGGSSTFATTYNGNGGTGFGGIIGNSTLTINDGGQTIQFSLTPGASFTGNNALIIYLDTKAGGVNNTSTFTDHNDPGRTAISGFNGSDRTIAYFPTGFGADYAVTVAPDTNRFSGTFDLSTPNSFGFVQGNNIAGSGTGPITFNVNKSSLGLATTGAYNFSFLGSLISQTAFRSNESIGTSDTGNGGPNAGSTGAQTFSTFDTYSSTPEPVTLGFGAGAALLCVRSRRSARSIWSLFR